jgi:hypothetical protein
MMSIGAGLCGGKDLKGRDSIAFSFNVTTFFHLSGYENNLCNQTSALLLDIFKNQQFPVKYLHTWLRVPVV